MMAPGFLQEQRWGVTQADCSCCAAFRLPLREGEGQVQSTLVLPQWDWSQGCRCQALFSAQGLVTGKLN